MTGPKLTPEFANNEPETVKFPKSVSPEVVKPFEKVKNPRP